jgi:hypothetical protein
MGLENLPNLQLKAQYIRFLRKYCFLESFVRGVEGRIFDDCLSEVSFDYEITFVD